MGKAAMILVMTISVTLLVFGVAMYKRNAEAARVSSERYCQTRARNIAASAVEIYLKNILVNGDSSLGTFTLPEMMQGAATVTVSTPNPSMDSLYVTGVGTFESTAETVEVSLGRAGSYPPMYGALNVSAGSKINLATTTVDTIDGNEHNLDGSLSSACPGVHGLVYEKYGDVSGTLNVKIKGVGSYVPDTLAMPGQPDYKAFAAQLIGLATVTLSSNTTTAPLTLGTVSHPQITHIKGGITLHGPTAGAGILVIEPGNGTFQTSTTFSFTGLIVVVDTNSIDTKSQVKFGSQTTIIGAMIMQGTQVKLDASTGSTLLDLMYSCQAVALAYGLLPSGGSYTISSWWE